MGGWPELNPGGGHKRASAAGGARYERQTRGEGTQGPENGLGGVPKRRADWPTERRSRSPLSLNESSRTRRLQRRQAAVTEPAEYQPVCRSRAAAPAKRSGFGSGGRSGRRHTSGAVSAPVRNEPEMNLRSAGGRETLRAERQPRSPANIVRRAGATGTEAFSRKVFGPGAEAERRG